MADEAVGAFRRQTPKGRADAEPPTEREEAGEAQACGEHQEDEPAREPHGLPGYPPEIGDLRVGVGIRRDDGDAGRYGAVHYGG